MPHFVIDCSKNVLKLGDPADILHEVHGIAEASGLFKAGDIKVRLRPFEYFVVGGSDDDFIHVFANIMEGRTVEQRAELSKSIVSKLKSMFPDVPVISMNIREFERATYTNRNLV